MASAVVMFIPALLVFIFLQRYFVRGVMMSGIKYDGPGADGRGALDGGFGIAAMRGSLRTHLERDVLAWWSQHGADDDLGGVRTCFTNRCEPLSAEKYTWSQGRWAWTCALIAEEIGAGRLEGDRALWHQRALRTAGFLAEHAFLADGRTAFRLGERGEALADAHGGTCHQRLRRPVRRARTGRRRPPRGGGGRGHVRNRRRESRRDRSRCLPPRRVALAG